MGDGRWEMGLLFYYEYLLGFSGECVSDGALGRVSASGEPIVGELGVSLIIFCISILVCLSQAYSNPWDWHLSPMAYLIF